MDEKHILTDTIVYSVLKYTSLFLVILSTTVILKNLPVAVFGVYSGIMLVLEYVRFIYRPSLAASQKRIPYLKAKHKNVQHIRDFTYGPTFYIMLAIAIIVFGVSFTVYNPVKTGLQLATLLIMFQHFNFFHVSFLMADKRFGKLGMMDVMLAGTRLYLLFLFINKGLTGVLMAHIIAYIFTMIFGLIIAPYKFSFSLRNFRKDAWVLNWKIGMLPALVFIISTAFVTIDRWIIIKEFDSTSLGYYGFAVFIITLVGYVPMIIGSVMFPRQVEAFGRNSNIKKLGSYLLFPSTVIAYSVPLIIMAAFIFIEFFVKFFAEQYLPAVNIAYILILASFFSSSIAPVTNFLVSIDHEIGFIKIRGSMLLVAVFLNLLAVYLGYGLIGIAFATSISFVLEFILLVRYSFRIVGEKTWKYVRMFIPFAYMCLIIYVMNFYKVDLTWEISVVAALIIKYLVAVILYSPCLIYMLKFTRLKDSIYIKFLKKPAFDR